MRPVVKYLLLCFSIILVLAGCRLFMKRGELPPEARHRKQVGENIRLVFSQQDIDTTYILSFYKKRDFNPAWVDNPEMTQELTGMLEGAAYYGLDSADYSAGKIRHILNKIEQEDNKDVKNKLFATADLQLTRSYLLFASHVSGGRLDPETLEERDSLLSGTSINAHLAKAIDKKNIKQSIEALEPQQPDYKNLRNALAQYLQQVDLTTDSISIPDPKKDSVACYAKVKEILVMQNYIDSAQVKNDSLAVNALKRFQRQHGLTEDGKAGENTRKALSISTYERYRQIVVNLERWRWESDWGKRYVFVNIPAYHLKVYEQGKQHMMLNVIVGKPITPTPTLSSKFENIVTNPFWHVPTSIYSKELLPEIKEDPQAYLAKHSYKVFDKENNAVDPSSVNWEEADDYRIRQDAGNSNALGLLKFNFQNKHQVYLHDTPSRSLFVKETRSMSHGCVRVQHPIKLAEYLLKVNSGEYTVADVQELIDRGVNRHIVLKEQVPVHIRYFTCEADSERNIYFYRDVYNKDAELKAKLFNDQQKQQQVALL